MVGWCTYTYNRGDVFFNRAAIVLCSADRERQQCNGMRFTFDCEIVPAHCRALFLELNPTSAVGCVAMRPPSTHSNTWLTGYVWNWRRRRACFLYYICDGKWCNAESELCCSPWCMILLFVAIGINILCERGRVKVGGTDDPRGNFYSGVALKQAC